MLAEILANPVAWPLWAVLAFAVTMYPLGLLMPGCLCCSSGCTQCGHLYYGYQEGQFSAGRLCCTGTIVSSVTLRLTNIGPATSNLVTRVGAGSVYNKNTAAFACSSLSGDYVLPLVRQVFGNGTLTPEATCRWTLDVARTCSTGGFANVQPYLFYTAQQTPGQPLNFPNYYLFMPQFEWKIAGFFRTQRCSGHPGPESCNTGTTYQSNSWVAKVDFGPPQTPLLPRVVLSEQRCNPAGIVFDRTIRLLSNESCDFPGFDPFMPTGNTGCEFQVELV